MISSEKRRRDMTHRCSTDEGIRVRSAQALAWAALACSLAVSGVADANTLRKSDPKEPRNAVRPHANAPRSAIRIDGPVVTVDSTAAEQAGYIHYFVITGPDGQAINHVGVELPGNRIASSFPDDGVAVAPFFKQGALTTSAGNIYEVEHLYGVRPFADDASMRDFQQALASRVQPWLDAKTPYCDELTPSRELCVSCLSFVMSVLYPDAVPRDFKGMRKNLYTTDDLLLYLTGVPVDAPREARVKRIAALALPKSMREELVRISDEIDDLQTAAARVSAPAASERRPGVGTVSKRGLARRRS